MATFLFSYRMSKDYVPGRPDAVAAWTAWFKELGASLADPGNPVFERATLGYCGEDTVLGGYSLVTADDLDAALALAKGCPALQRGAGLEVGVITDLGLRQDGAPA